MKYMRDSLLEIYRDFYGGDPETADDKSVERNSKSGVKKPADGRKDAVSRNDAAGRNDAESGSGFGSPSFDDLDLETTVGSDADSGEASDTGIEIEFQTETVSSADEEDKEPEKSGMEELEELIGLATVKHDVEELISLAKVRKMREDKGMKSAPVSLHLVFSGNPGTGKTTVARILAKLYKEIGILSEGQLVETDRAGLVAGYVGQTAIKTKKKIEEAMGGVLFIDEAYTLNQEGENFGQEAIDTILKAMEDHRDQFIVIVAGYTNLMKDFVESNPGLRSRFNKFFEFPDYTVEELQEIFKLQCTKYQYTLTDEAETAVKNEIVRLESSKGENFANAREVRNLFEKIITNQAARVADLENIDEETLTTITAEDLEDLERLDEQTAEERAAELVGLIDMLCEQAVDAASEDADEASAEDVDDVAVTETDAETASADESDASFED